MSSLEKRLKHVEEILERAFPEGTPAPPPAPAAAAADSDSESETELDESDFSDVEISLTNDKEVLFEHDDWKVTLPIDGRTMWTDFIPMENRASGLRTDYTLLCALGWCWVDGARVNILISRTSPQNARLCFGLYKQGLSKPAKFYPIDSTKDIEDNAKASDGFD